MSSINFHDSEEVLRILDKSNPIVSWGVRKISWIEDDSWGGAVTKEMRLDEIVETAFQRALDQQTFLINTLERAHAQYNWFLVSQKLKELCKQSDHQVDNSRVDTILSVFQDIIWSIKVHLYSYFDLGEIQRPQNFFRLNFRCFLRSFTSDPHSSPLEKACLTGRILLHEKTLVSGIKVFPEEFVELASQGRSDKLNVDRLEKLSDQYIKNIEENLQKNCRSEEFFTERFIEILTGWPVERDLPPIIARAPLSSRSELAELFASKGF